MRKPGLCHLITGAAIILLTVNSCKKEDTEVKIIPDFNGLSAFVIDEEGNKIMATGQAIYVFDGSEWSSLEIDRDQFLNINEIEISNEGELEILWMATNAGLLNYNDGSVLNTANSPIGIDNIDHINIPDQDKILLTNQNGVFIKTDTGWYTSTGKNDLFLDFEITGIETASNLYTYVSTNGGGIGRFKYDVDGVSGETIMDSDWTDLETNVINDVFVYDTVQYYATDKGIGFHFSEYTKWDWQIYTRQDGLVSDTALTINRDMEGNLWIGTYRGISKFNGEESWENYTVKSHNIISDTVSFIEIDTDGSVWIASPRGLSQFKNNSWTNFTQ